MKPNLLALGATVLAAGPALSQDTEPFLLGEIVVSAGLTPVAVNRTGATVETLDQTEIVEGGANVVQTLSTLPGLSYSQNGGLGGNATLRIRGLGGNYIGVRIDGMDFTNPSSPQTAFNFGTLTAGLPSRIEVLKGAQSAIYGSNAIAGVVDITTWRPEEPGISGRAAVEAGTYDTYSGILNLGQKSERGEIALTFSHVQTDGFSALSTDDEDDGFEQTLLTLSAAYDLTETLRLGVSALYSEGTAEFDRSATDPSGELDETRQGARVFAQVTTGSVEHIFAVSAVETEQFDEGGFTEKFVGDRTMAEYLGSVELNPDLHLAFGADWTEERAKLDESSYDASNSAAFSELQYAATDALDLSLSLRYDDYSDFDDQLSGRGALAWRLPQDLILRAVIGTGYRAPSLYERFGPYSLPGVRLQPEESRSVEIGLEKIFGADSFAKATLFYSEIEDLIDFFDPDGWAGPVPGGYRQIEGTTEVKGLELSGSYAMTQAVELFGNYTYTDAEGPSGRVIRVPRHDLSLGVEASLSDRIDGQLALHRVADTLDYTSYPDTGPLDDYTVVSAGASLALNDRTEAYLRLENLFDEDYETVRGYNTPGRSIYVGLRASF